VRQPGEFTRLFRSPASDPTPLLPKEDPFSGDEEFASGAAKSFGEWQSFAGQGTPPGTNHGATQAFTAPAAPQAPPTRLPEGPSEYTRVFIRPPATSPVPDLATTTPIRTQTPAPEVTGSALKKRQGSFILLAALTFLAACATILIVYFATKK
jgi:hypothetical protein